MGTCLHCGCNTSNPKFCSRSCSASYNNARVSRGKKKRNTIICAGCSSTFEAPSWSQRKYCSNKCQAEQRTREIFERIEKGSITESDRSYRLYLIGKNGPLCEKCGWSAKHPVTGNFVIELNHIDGDSYNCSLDNLELLCPNCHALTDNFKSLNKGNGTGPSGRNIKARVAFQKKES